MQPTIRELEQYIQHLYKKELFNEVMNYIKHDEPVVSAQVQSIDFKGDWEYNDEGGFEFCLSKILVATDEGELVYNWSNAELLMDHCYSDCKKIDVGQKITPADLEEPFQLTKS